MILNQVSESIMHAPRKTSPRNLRQQFKLLKQLSKGSATLRGRAGSQTGTAGRCVAGPSDM